MLDLKARVEFEELEIIFCVILEICLEMEMVSEVNFHTERDAHSTFLALTSPTSFARRTAARSIFPKVSNFAMVTGDSLMICWCWRAVPSNHKVDMSSPY